MSQDVLVSVGLMGMTNNEIVCAWIDEWGCSDLGVSFNMPGWFDKDETCICWGTAIKMKTCSNTILQLRNWDRMGLWDPMSSRGEWGWFESDFQLTDVIKHVRASQALEGRVAKHHLQNPPCAAKRITWPSSEPTIKSKLKMMVHYWIEVWSWPIPRMSWWWHHSKLFNHNRGGWTRKGYENNCFLLLFLKQKAQIE